MTQRERKREKKIETVREGQQYKDQKRETKIVAERKKLEKIGEQKKRQKSENSAA